jgi:hypothetical protein
MKFHHDELEGELFHDTQSIIEDLKLVFKGRVATLIVVSLKFLLA